eukprot:933422-Prorocentrum_minimum.AAC.2
MSGLECGGRGGPGCRATHHARHLGVHGEGWAIRAAAIHLVRARPRELGGRCRRRVREVPVHGEAPPAPLGRRHLVLAGPGDPLRAGPSQEAVAEREGGPAQGGPRGGGGGVLAGPRDLAAAVQVRGALAEREPRALGALGGDVVLPRPRPLRRRGRVDSEVDGRGGPVEAAAGRVVRPGPGHAAAKVHRVLAAQNLRLGAHRERRRGGAHLPRTKPAERTTLRIRNADTRRVGLDKSRTPRNRSLRPY